MSIFYLLAFSDVSRAWHATNACHTPFRFPFSLKEKFTTRNVPRSFSSPSLHLSFRHPNHLPYIYAKDRSSFINRNTVAHSWSGKEEISLSLFLCSRRVLSLVPYHVSTHGRRWKTKKRKRQGEERMRRKRARDVAMKREKKNPD